MNTISNKDIKLLRSLSQKKFRDEYGMFTVEGEKLVAEALRSDYEVVDLFRRDEIGEEQMARISSLSTPSPVLALVRKPEDKSFDPSVLNPDFLGLALDDVSDPGNMGTIIRIADWFGVDMIFVSENSVDYYNPKVVQSTMGAIFRRKIIRCKLAEVCNAFTTKGLKIFGTFLDGDDIYAKDLAKAGLVIMGNESRGVSEELAAMVTDRLYIPPYPPDACTSESLNVAVATAVTIAEFRRRNV